MEIIGNIKTTIVCDDDKSHVYSITKDFGTENKSEAIILTLHPTITEPNIMDLSMTHCITHAISDEGLGWGKITFVYLFSKVIKGKVALRGLSIDESNLDYLRKLIGSKPDAKIVISFGSSYSNSEVVNESKMRFFQMVKEIRPDEPLWQLAADGMVEEAPHILYAGIRYAEKSFYLTHYMIPHCYTPEGHQAYLKQKEVRKALFEQNVLNRKKSEVEPIADGATKGKRKNGDKKS